MRYLGRKAELPNLLRGVGRAAARGARHGRQGRQRGAPGARGADRARARASSRPPSSTPRLAADRVDVTLPGDPPQPVGRLHLLTQTRREIEDVFVGLGFTVVEGPEVETVHYNFDALNHDPTHPARGAHRHLLRRRRRRSCARTPRRCRSARWRPIPPPLYVVIPGRVYRRDSDATHTPQFHQVEGLAVDEDITLADLKGTLLAFARAIFGDDRDVRLRPHFFPFTEPSVEVDVSCFNCDGTAACGRLALPRSARARAGSRSSAPARSTPTSSPTSTTTATTPRRSRASPWAWASSAIAMLKHGVPDLRLFYDNDLRFLEQFG